MRHQICTLMTCGLMSMYATAAHSQVSVDLPGLGVKVQAGSSGNGSKSEATVDSDVEMEGVAVINGEVFIDGQKVPKGKTVYKSRKTGKSYRVRWGKNGNVDVSEE